MLLKTIFSFDFRHTLFNQLWRMLSGPMLLVLVPLYLTPEIQGFWYTFISLAALVVLADMGFSTILLQFSAHEYSNLQTREDGFLTGKIINLERLAALLKFAIRWSLFVGVIIFPVVLVTGYLILNSRGALVDWVAPWVLYGMASIFVFANSMLFSFMEGCDCVGGVQKIRFQTSVTTVLITIILLVLGFDLYSLAVSLLLGNLIGTLIFFIRYHNILGQLLSLRLNNIYPWWSEIMPLLWRYSISWVSGYFVLYIFTPLAFVFYGTLEAGAVGLSISICGAIFSIANVWITVITPKINMMVAKQQYEDLNFLFIRNLMLSVLTFVAAIVVFVFIIFYLDVFYFIRDRLVSIDMFLMLVCGWLAQIVINGLAVYMRAHKQEPLMMINLYAAVCIGSSTLLISMNLPIEYFFVGFISSYVWILPLVVKKYIVFYKNKSIYAEGRS
jgi:hypothetical protein